MLKNVIDGGASNEQLLTVTSIWKLTANNYKSKHTIKSSSISTKLSNLAHRLDNDSNYDRTELSCSLEILNEILNN